MDGDVGHRVAGARGFRVLRGRDESVSEPEPVDDPGTSGDRRFVGAIITALVVTQAAWLIVLGYFALRLIG